MVAHTPDWLLERIALNELPASHVAARTRLLAESDGPARLARLEEDSRRTLERFAPAQVAAEVERRRRLQALAAEHATVAHPWFGSLTLGFPVAACLILLVLSASRDLTPETRTLGVSPLEWETVRIKGAARLLVHRQGAREPESLPNHSQAHRGDLLQLSYLSGGRRHGAVVSLDGRGAVTLHFPERLTGSTALKAGEAVSLPHAYELDDAPSFERFIFVTSDSPVDVAAVLEAARRVARQPQTARELRLPLPESLAQTSFTLEKVP
ncbi:ActD protein [Corallococcus sp. H22C18031201]|uniref:ActD protein n=1 Tax=Citreicoccus inhibens TaxID=2849499 RepID=UPI000E7243CD|nr:ActD protein [Citreicoccus inhibens]MBU8900612.1 DUF4384 domain-containing protein [Citreicoccus inhibens]RJS16325.1 ActD protein [Corallococcus sp. H22C18031201]